MTPYIKCDEAVCGNCIHFRQHYVRWGLDHYHPISYGHCTFPRNKRRKIGDNCPNWKAVSEE